MEKDFRRVSVRTLVTAASFGLAAVFPSPGSAQIAVDAAELVLAAGPSASMASFSVTNESAAPVEVTVYLGDWDRNENGGHRFFDPGTTETSCVPLLEVFPLALRLEPGEVQPVRLSLAGESLSAACWALVFVETRRNPEPGRVQVAFVTRVGVKIYGIPPGLSTAGSIEHMEVVPVAEPDGNGEGGLEVAVLYRNVGGLPLEVNGWIEVRRSDNTVVERISVDEIPVLPGAPRRIATPLGDLEPGYYVVIAVLDDGGAELLAGQIEVEIGS